MNRLFISAGMTVLMSCVMAACNGPAGSGGQSQKSGSTDPSKKIVTLSTLAFESFSTTTIYTSDAGTNNCASFSVVGKSAKDEAVPSANITLSLIGVEADQLKEYGQLSTAITTGSDGKANGTFCAAKKTGKVIIYAQSDAITANSGEITITVKPEYEFIYRNSDFDSANSKPGDVIKANLLDSGPNDCGNLYFRLRKLDNPVQDVTIKFTSDFGYPAGSKLRARSSTDTPYETDSTSLKKFLSFTATSDTDGIFKIPFCAGQIPGSLIVFATYTDEYGKTHNAKTPTISISSGTANLTTMALTFNDTNARTLKALFNSEVPSPIDFFLRISSVFSSTLSVFNPVYLHSESGTLNIENGGVPDETGSLKFSMLASYNGSARPTPVRIFNDAGAQTTCNPEAIAKELNVAVTAGNFKVGSVYRIESTGTTSFTSIGAANNSVGTSFMATGAGTGTGTAKLALSYSELAVNWRSTLVYAMRGQESFNDANRNGKYDTGGDGFWDKDQDGAYTQGVDAVTYFGSIAGGAACRCLDAAGAPLGAAPTAGIQATPCIETTTQTSCFRRNSEWFIDLPTPFVDANENGIYEETVAGQVMDRLIGDVYDQPNGKRDVDTLVWKSTTLPIYTGTSPYTMVRSSIAPGSILNLDSNPSSAETIGATNYFKDLSNRNLMDATELNYISHAWDNLVAKVNMDGDDDVGFQAWRWVGAHGVCGTPAPGGTTVSATPRLISELFGSRTVTTHFYMQPGDTILDPSRRLLADATGASSTKLNFNVPDHASAKAGYPVKYQVKIPGCKRTVPNGVGVWCSAVSYEIVTKMDSDTVTTTVSAPEYKSAANPCPNPSFSKINYGTGSCEAP